MFLKLDFTENQIQRYARQIVLPEVGGLGQKKLLSAKVLVIGAGGLGAPLLIYLAAAGIGTLGVVDNDVVELSNLQRQIIHTTEAIGLPKVESARKTVQSINPDITFITHKERIKKSNVESIISDYDLIADGSDNFPTRFLINDACHFLYKTLVSAAISRFEGQISTFKQHVSPEYPCYRCLYKDPPPPGQIPSCSEGGVLGSLAGTIGALQATEVIKEILGIGDSLAGLLLLYNALETEIRRIKFKRDPACPLCGDKPTISDFSQSPAI